MASSKGMFTSTFLKVSKISLSTSSVFLVGIILGGNGRGMGDCYKSPLAEGALEEDLSFPTT